MYFDKSKLFHTSSKQIIPYYLLPKLKTIEIWPFALVKDFLTIGYYIGVIPFKLVYDPKANSWVLKSNLFNEVRHCF